MNRKAWLLVLVGLVACLLGLASCGDEVAALQEHFPMWEELEYDWSDLLVTPGVELEFQGIDFRTHTSNDGTECYDEVLVHLKNTGDKGVHRNSCYDIYYLYEGRWYQVEDSGDSEDLFGSSYKPKTEEDISFLVHSGFFDIPGQYRLYYSGIGFCDIDIVFSPDEN